MLEVSNNENINLASSSRKKSKINITREGFVPYQGYDAKVDFKWCDYF